MQRKRESAIASVTLNTATFHHETIHPTYINYFFGRNGVGKTTIGRCIFDGTCVEWNEDENPGDYEVLLFNKDFISTYFKSFDKVTGIFSISEDAKEASRNLEIYLIKHRLSEIDEELQKAERNFASATEYLHQKEEDFRNAYSLKVTDLSASYPKLLPSTLSSDIDLHSFVKALSNIKPIAKKDDNLDFYYDAVYNKSQTYHDFLDIIDAAAIDTIPSCSLLEEVITSNNSSPFSININRLGATEWVMDGYKRFHALSEYTCPYCQQPINDKTSNQLKSCFTQEYELKVSELQNFLESYRQHLSYITAQLPQVPNTTEPYYLHSLIQQYMACVEKYNFTCMLNVLTIEKKIENPSASEQIEDIAPILRKINKVITSMNKLIEKHNGVFYNHESTADFCDNEVKGLLADRLADEIKEYLYAYEDYEEAKDDNRDATFNLNCEREELLKELEEFGSPLAIITPSINSINRLLSLSGFSGFKVIEHEDLYNSYQVVRTDTGNSVATNLSDGELNYLAFLYFYNLVKGVDKDTHQKKKIVIIDDPISSLDSHAFNYIISLVRELVDICYSSADYRDTSSDCDIIKQIFILTHNIQFYNSIIRSMIGKYDCVNLYSVTKTDEHSSIELCSRQSKNKSGENVNYSPIKNPYVLLWENYFSSRHVAELINTAYRILEYYFLDMCGEDTKTLNDIILVDNRHRFVITASDGSKDTSILNSIEAILQYVKPKVNDEFLSYDEISEEQIRAAFKTIFYQLGQSQHYDMMVQRCS